MITNMQQGQLADCQRSIHKYNSFTQNSMRTIEKLTGKRDPPPDNAYGAIAGSQREEAILVQRATQHKCITNKLSYVTSFYDSSNAFYCCQHDSIKDYRMQTHGELGKLAIKSSCRQQYNSLRNIRRSCHNVPSHRSSSRPTQRHKYV